MAAEATPGLLYLPELPGPGSSLLLEPADARYVARVCRARVGERLEATDGRGHRADLRLVEVRKGVVAEVETVRSDPPGRRAWVLCGAPEGERADWLVEKLAELGVERFVPVDAARGRWRRAADRRARWERLAIAGLRQSRRSRLMALEEPLPLAQALDRVPGYSERWLAEATGSVTAAGTDPAVEVAVGLVGPSGGLDPQERQAALESAFQPMRLAGARLRTETAAMAWAVWWSLRGA